MSQTYYGDHPERRPGTWFSVATVGLAGTAILRDTSSVLLRLFMGSRR